MDSQGSTDRIRAHHQEGERKETDEDKEEKEGSKDNVGFARAGVTRAQIARARGKAKDKDGSMK